MKLKVEVYFYVNPTEGRDPTYIPEAFADAMQKYLPMGLHSGDVEDLTIGDVEIIEEDEEEEEE